MKMPKDRTTARIAPEGNRVCKPSRPPDPGKISDRKHETRAGRLMARFSAPGQRMSMPRIVDPGGDKRLANAQKQVANGSAKPGLSRRRSRVRVPSLPFE